MASSALKKAREQMNRRATSMRNGFKRRTREGAVYRHSAAAATGAAFAIADRNGLQKTIMGVPWKLGVIAGGLLAEAFGKGLVQHIGGGVASGSIAIYTNRGVATGSVIAGDDDGDDV